MADVPEYVRLADFKGRSFVVEPSQLRTPDATFEWRARAAELDMDPRDVAVALEGMIGQEAPFDLWRQPHGDEAFEESERRVRVLGVHLAEEGKAVIAELAFTT